MWDHGGGIVRLPVGDLVALDNGTVVDRTTGAEPDVSVETNDSGRIVIFGAGYE